MLSKFLILFLKYFDILGYCTEYSILLFTNNGKSQSKRSAIVFVIHGFIFTIICILLHRFFLNPIIEFDAAGTTNELIKDVGAAILYGFIIVESMCKRSNHQQFWNFFKSIKELRKNQENISAALFFGYFVKFALYFTIVYAL